MMEMENAPSDRRVADLDSHRQLTSDDRSMQLDWENLLRTAMESSSHGLCIFDSRLRLVIANNHHREMYALTPAQTIPGLPIQEVVRIDWPD